MACPNDDLGGICINCTCKYKTVAVIPCFGRFKLIEKTVERLYKVNGISKVILIGHEGHVELIAKNTNSIYVNHKNNPLGKKWNVGFEEARKLNPDAVLFVGSSDWISNDWLKTALKYLPEYDLIGKLGCHLLDINTNGINRLVEWPGYGKGVRSKEPIGIGRVISARILDKFNWKPFDDNRDNSMDWFMYEKVLKNGGKIKIMEEDVYAMAISTNLWPQKHQFEDHWCNKLPSTRLTGDQMKDFLSKNFSDAIDLKLS